MIELIEMLGLGVFVGILLTITFPFIIVYLASLIVYLGHLGIFVTSVHMDPKNEKARRYHMIRMRVVGGFGFIYGLLLQAAVTCAFLTYYIAAIVLGSLFVLTFIGYIIYITKNKKLARYYFLADMLEKNPNYEDEFSISDKYYQFDRIKEEIIVEENDDKIDEF